MFSSQVIRDLGHDEFPIRSYSAVISWFKELPRVAFYDNTCNLAWSVSLQFAWVMNQKRILCHRFHYRALRCSPELYPDSYADFNHLLTIGAESLNRQWASSSTNIAYLAGDNLIPFLYSMAVFIDLRSHLRKMSTYIRDIQSWWPVNVGDAKYRRAITKIK